MDGMLGRRLRQLRKARKLTQEEVADAMGVSQAYIAQLESGARTNPSLKFLRRLARLLGTSVPDLIQ